MTTNEKRAPPLSVGWDIASDFKKTLASEHPDPFIWLANRITEAVNAARTASGDALRQAYDAGFDASCEGWNGEHPGDALDDPDYQAKRDKWLASRPNSP